MIEVKNLEVVYNDVILVLKGISLNIQKGQITSLLGPNGAGKTSTLRAITGLLDFHRGKVTKGEVLFSGQSVTHLAPDKIVEKGLSQVMEGRRIFADLSVEENLLVGGHTQNRSFISDNLEKNYQRFPILADRRRGKAGFLSGGEQQMLAIARALMANPKVLILDEPSLGLAPKIVHQVAGLIQTLHADEGVTIFLVEQNASLALSISQHAYILENGKVVHEGKSEDLKADKDIQEFYLGLSGAESKSYKEVKRYKRRKRWLS